MSTKYEVILFQPYLRKFVLNFGNNLRRFTFYNTSNPPILGGGYHKLPTFEMEILRTKSSWQSHLRRIIGIPNIRPYFKNRGDLLFTYGCLLLTWKPYCVYIETGVALYNYDLKIAKNPVARFIVGFLATRSTCKQLIFVSEAAKKSFFSSVHYGKSICDSLQQKSVVIYPIPIEQQGATEAKRFMGQIKLLFPGTFYMKGGLEVVRAYEKLRKSHDNISLTVVTALHMLRDQDIKHMQSLPGLTILDAKLNEKQMAEMYRSHDLLLLPTYREGFGLVLVEALSYAMPIIITDQYATGEMIQEGINGFSYPNPLRDYDTRSFQMFGRYHDPKAFYKELFSLQNSGKLSPIEDFLVNSVEKFIKDPSLLERQSRASLALYSQKFDSKKLSEKIEEVFLKSVTR